MKKLKTKNIKKLYAIALLAFIGLSLNAQTWSQLTSGTTTNLIGVSAPSAAICYASGNSGLILKTINGGTSWAQQTSGTIEDLYSIAFTDINNGYAVGNNGAAVKTINGGASWTPMSVPTSNVSFRCVYFFNDSIGYITGGVSPGTILKTTNAGNTWTSLPTSGTSTNVIYSIWFTSAAIGYANDWNGNIIKTINGGTSWSLASAIGINALAGGIRFTNASTGFVLGQNGEILKTSSSGANWSPLTSGTTDALSMMDFYDANNGYIVGGNINANTGTMLVTADGGNTWTPVTLSPGISRLSRIDFADQNTGYAVGLNGTILKYTSCPPGNGWTSLTSGTTTNLIGVSAPSAAICYASGNSGLILKTINGGTSWTQQTSGTIEDLYSIAFTDINNGYAVGNNGAAVKTINGGASWTPMSVPTSNVSFRCIYFFNDSTGYITGGVSPGTILKTTNAGNTWTSLPTSGASTNVIYSIWFTSAAIGYANDWNGNIIKTINGGTSWSLASAIGINALAGGIRFTNASTGFVLGQNGEILKTSNSGANWSPLTSGTSDALSMMDFYDANNGYIAGGNINANTGTMLVTADGGNTWVPVTLSPGISRLSRIDFADQNTGYAVGLNGTILKYTACQELTTSISENNRGNNNDKIFKVYPNPFSTQTIISFNEEQKNTSIKIIDMLGKEIKSINFTGRQLILEKEEMKPGIYFLQISDEIKNGVNRKIVVQ